MIDIKLRILLAERRMTVTELSEMTGISRSTLYPLKNNKSKMIQLNTLNKIMMALNIDGISQLIEYIPTEKTINKPIEFS
ncbi:helix-turn-helix domain-containing protein [Dellaglioa algida]|uniref:helix-turn-helix domain-containing protein n=1 Tax=Dellaglioa algida TaxID=105612 RepID=UPI0024C4A3F4|nr:helix-turn-helix transcriptional regulator [Dellaglioa algida]MDK1716604.1 helix-turn-helix transcriptional regulator [Dellaglioa algida]MDK1721546.1 helix-turn-helix transcriptional regulator [Dellaglioa algida]